MIWNDNMDFFNGLKQNLSLEMIASIAGISIEEVEQYIKDNRLDKK